MEDLDPIPQDADAAAQAAEVAAQMQAAALAAAQAEAEAEAAEREALAASLAALAAANAQAKPTLLHDDTVAAPQGSFGPTFADELMAAGVAGLAYAYGAASITFAATITAEDRAKVMAVVAAHDPSAKPAPIVPDNPTLGDWRVGLTLWLRTDADGPKVSRLTDVTKAVQALVASGNPLGAVAQERLEYSNNVRRDELLQLAPAFAFTPADVDESLFRARQVSLGDLSGAWPLPAVS